MKKIQELKELKTLSRVELFRKLKEQERRLADLRFKAAFRKVKNFREIRLIKKRIAWIWTILAEKTQRDLLEKGRLASKEVKNEKEN